MTLICAAFVVGQVYFDLRLPDYMTELTMLIKTSGASGDIWNVGLKMLGCTLISALLAVICGYLAAKTASGFSYTVRGKVFRCRRADAGAAAGHDGDLSHGCGLLLCE